MASNSDWELFQEIIAAQKKGIARGIYSICSSNLFVLDAAAKRSVLDHSFLLVESTCNQVNQYGGYTGMRPKDFTRYLFDITQKYGLPDHKVIVGADHIGPSVWKSEPAEISMAKACSLVEECIKAGYTKIHLDASMHLEGDDPDLPFDEIAAERSALLCEVSENTAAKYPNARGLPFYVIGTEVPPPGGSKDASHHQWISNPNDVENVINISKNAFEKRGLSKAWERVVGIVVQPGVEFGVDFINDYSSESAKSLSMFIETSNQLIYEAHSTDYQLRENLKKMVQDHFAILKVGPALTFALREAIFALSFIERELITKQNQTELSNIQENLEEAMQKDPGYWNKFYTGSLQSTNVSRKFSYSDRIRYYWTNPNVLSSVDKLLKNLESLQIPDSLVSQFFPAQYKKIRNRLLNKSPRDLITDKINEILGDYSYACGLSKI
jgi:D-tagatose-1,6-bisphosphate aldolase subunit GatZ/KbaZ